MRPAHSPLALLLWTGVAVLAHVLVALFSVLSRWLQVEPHPPLPALRVALLINLLALVSLAVGSALVQAGRWLLVLHRHLRCRQQGGRPPCPGLRFGDHHNESKRKGASSVAGLPGTDGSSRPPSPTAVVAVASAAAAAAAVADGRAAGLRMAAEEGRPDNKEMQLPMVRARAAASKLPASPFQHSSSPPSPTSQSQHIPHHHWQQQEQGRQQVPELLLQRGLSGRVRGLQVQRPRLVRLSALALLTVTYAVGCACQVAAAGMVDAAVVQLVLMFTVVGVALVQRLLLSHRLPPLIWPCAAAMLGGAAMILVPTFGQSSSSAGLNSARGWLGLGLSLVTLAATVANFVTLQASRTLAFTSLQLQFYYLGLSVLLLLPLSLPIDGTDWAVQFRGWDGASWAVLLVNSCVVYPGLNFALQHAMWQLGAAAVSMFFGLRLVAAIVESRLILGKTVISAGLQVAGAVLTVGAVTVYMWWQWVQSKRQAAAAAAEMPTAAAAPAGSGRESTVAPGE